MCQRMHSVNIGSITVSVFRPVIKDFVDDGTGVLLGSDPVVGCHVILRLFKGVCTIIVIARHLDGRATRREADLGLRWGQAAFSYELMALAFLAGRDILFGIDVAIRLRVGTCGRPEDWCGLV